MENREDDEQERLLNNQIKEVQDAARVAKKAASGNWIGAAKDALKSDAFKKKLKKTLIKWAIQALLWLVLIGAIVGIVTAIVDNMISLFASIGTNVNGFFTEIWQQLTDDYWTNIGEREDGDDTEFIIDTKEGRIVAYYKIVKKGSSGVSDNKELIFHKEDLKDLLEEKQRAGEYVGKTVYDLDENELWMLTEEYLNRLGRENLITQKYTLVDAYLRDLGDQGISIKDLRLLGNADYSDEKKLLEDPKNKALVEKYMSEFIRADIITQQIHKRDHIGVVNGEEPDDGDDDNNQNEVDGGLYLYRSKSHEDIDLSEIEDEMVQIDQDTKSKVLFVGDSRTIDMFYNADGVIGPELHDGISVCAGHGLGFGYLQETINSYGADNFDVLISWMGGNDNGDFSNYKSLYSDLISQGKKVILCTVGPMDDAYLAEWDRTNYANSRAETYNTALKGWAIANGVQVIDMYTYINNNSNITIDTADGIHYLQNSQQPTTQLWNYIISQLPSETLELANQTGNNSATVTSNGSDSSTGNGEYEYMPEGEIHKTQIDKDEDYTRMIYVDKEEFDAGLQIATNQDTFYAIHKGNQRIDIRDVYTLDKETGDVLVAEITASYDIERDDLDPQAGWFKEKPNSVEKSKSSISNLDITATPYIVQYREYVAKYAMTYEFLINLCQVTQNPEFVYHVALLARDTDISLIMLDTEHITKTVKETLYDHYYYENYEGSYIPPGAISHTQDKGRYTHVEFELHPEMKVKYANAWTYYEAFSFLRTLDGEIKERPSPERTYDTKTSLGNKGTKTFIDENNNQVSVDYWYDTLTNTESHIRDMVLDVTYEEVPIISQEKSKQFLGLLRNGSGECKHDCYKDPDPKNNPEALKCSQEAVFKRSGTNVAYTIPGTTEKEMAYNKLTGGIELLYAALQNNTTGYSASDKVLGKQYDKNEDTMQDVIEDPEDSEEIAQKSTSYAAQHDYGSSYVVKLEPIVEHLKYLMTLPGNEYVGELRTLNWQDPNYTKKIDYNSEGDYDDDENYVPKHTWNGTTSELIELLGKLAREDMQESGILASVTVAQALLESGWGDSELAAKYNNFFGIKAGSNWNGPTVTYWTNEDDGHGNLYKVKAKFRVYDNIEDSIRDHSKLLSASRYNGVKGEKNYVTAIKIIKNGGYATDSKYVQKICDIIEKNGLTRFDK